MSSLNEVFSSLSARRRYEVWFVRLGLANNFGAWWFRYLLMNPGRHGADAQGGKPVQVWATWFPREGKPQTFIQGFSVESLELSGRGRNPFYFRVGPNAIEQDSCRGEVQVEGQAVSWNLAYDSTFRATMSDKGWIGFSRTPHSDALFSGQIRFNGRSFVGEPLGFGVQGHNCGYRHRKFWSWAHAYFPRPEGPPSTLEALVYEMPFGLVFRKAVLWHAGEEYVCRNLRESKRDQRNMQWDFECSSVDGLQLAAAFDGSGASLQHLPYAKTDGRGSFEVANNSLAVATLCVRRRSGTAEKLETTVGAVLEMVGG